MLSGLFACGVAPSADLAAPGTLRWTPSSLDFETVPQGIESSATAQIVNGTDRAVTLSVSPIEAPFRLQLDQDRLEPQEMGTGTMFFRPETNDVYETEIRIAGAAQEAVLLVRGIGGPCPITAEPATLTLVPNDGFAVEVVDIINPTAFDIEVLLGNGPNFSRCNIPGGVQTAFCAFLQDRIHDGDGNFPLGQSDVAPIEVHYTPQTTEATESGVLRLVTSDACVVDVPLLGQNR